MKQKKLKHIKFQNQQNSKSYFDIIKIEELYERTGLDHSIEQHHKVDFYILLFVEEGQGIHNIDFIDYQCSKGTLLTIRKDQIHKFSKEGNLKGKLLIFTNEFLVSYLQKIESQKIMLLFNEQLGKPKLQLSKYEFTAIQQSILQIQDEYFDVNDTHSLSIIRSELHILITKLFRLKATRERINLERKYLQDFIVFQNLVETNVEQTHKVKDFADEMNISTKTLNTITKSIINKSAKAFVDEISTKQIKRLLLNTNLSIKEIAYQSGFDETTNFYKYFKRQAQTTPEKFRNSN